MGKKEKLVNRFMKIPRDFSVSELDSLLQYFGYNRQKGGMTGGSRVEYRNKNGTSIKFHNPHPGKVLKEYQVKEIKSRLHEEGLL